MWKTPKPYHINYVNNFVFKSVITAVVYWAILSFESKIYSWNFKFKNSFRHAVKTPFPLVLNNINYEWSNQIYNYLPMNCNFYWQPAPISLIPTHPTCLYFDQSLIKNTNQIDFEHDLKQMKKKCKELDLENSELKEEISILEVSFWLISEN